LAEAAQDIEEELNTGDVEEVGTEVVANCKCDAFKKIHKALSSVRDMMCAPSDDRTGRNYYGYGANTLWFQYLLCQDESIPSLACWLFTSGWNQYDYGQYYLYDNLLGEDGAGLGLDGDILPLVVLSGGLGGGAYGGGHAYGGHPVYRRAVTDGNACLNGEVPSDDGQSCVQARKRRAVCSNGEVPSDDGQSCVQARKRRAVCSNGEVPSDDGQSCVQARKRRAVCSNGEVPSADGESCVQARKRRAVCSNGEVPSADGETCVRARKRRAVCPTGQKETADGTGCEPLQ